MKRHKPLPSPSYSHQDLKLTDLLIGALYGRVSNDDAASVEHGSLEQQVNMGKEMAQYLTLKNGIRHVIDHFLIEEKGVSGKDTNRPKLQRLIRLIKERKIKFVIAKEISRLFRSVKDLCDFLELCKQYGVAVHIRGLDLDPTTPIGSMMFKLLGILAEFERDLIVQRTKDSIRSAMLNNGKMNGSPTLLGFDLDPNHKGRWLPNSEELEKVIILMKVFNQTSSYKATLDYSYENQIMNKRGKRFCLTTLKRLLTSTKYIGKMTVTHGKNDELQTEVDLPFGVVIPLDLFNEVQKNIEKLNSRGKNQNQFRARVYLLSNLLQWHADGTYFTGVSGTCRSGSKKFYYRNKHQKISLPAPELEEVVLKSFKKFEKLNEVERLSKELNKSKSFELDQIHRDIRSLEKKLIKIQNDDGIVGELLLKSREGNNDAIEWLNQKIKFSRNEREVLERKITELRAEANLIKQSSTDAASITEATKSIIDRLFEIDPVKQRAFLREVISKIVVGSDNRMTVYWKLPDALPDRDYGDLSALEKESEAELSGDSNGENVNAPIDSSLNRVHSLLNEDNPCSESYEGNKTTSIENTAVSASLNQNDEDLIKRKSQLHNLTKPFTKGNRPSTCDSDGHAFKACDSSFEQANDLNLFKNLSGGKSGFVPRKNWGD